MGPLYLCSTSPHRWQKSVVVRVGHLLLTTQSVWAMTPADAGLSLLSTTLLAAMPSAWAPLSAVSAGSLSPDPARHGENFSPLLHDGEHERIASTRRVSAVSIGPSANMVGARHFSSRASRSPNPSSMLQEHESAHVHANSSEKWPPELAKVPKGSVGDNIEKIESKKVLLEKAMPAIDKEIESLNAKSSSIQSQLADLDWKIADMVKRKVSDEKKLKIVRVGWDLLLAAHLQTIRYVDAALHCVGDYDCPGDLATDEVSVRDAQDPDLGSFVDAHNSVYVLGIAAGASSDKKLGRYDASLINASGGLPPLFRQ